MDEILSFFSFNKGIGSEAEKKSALFLRTSSIILTFASSYTTFMGFSYYTPAFIALLLTVGVQGLLYSISWKIGEGVRSNSLKKLQIVILIGALSVSVFFSYSSLLEVVYPLTDRQEDELPMKKRVIYSIFTATIDSINNKVNITQKTADFNEKFLKWNERVLKPVAIYFANLTTEVDLYAAKQKRLEYELEKKQKDYNFKPDSIRAVALARAKNSERTNLVDKLFPNSTKRERCIALKYQHDSIFKYITQSNKNISIQTFSDLDEKKQELFPLILADRYKADSIKLPDSLMRELIVISEINNFKVAFDSLDILNILSVNELKIKSMELMQRFPSTIDADLGEYKKIILSIDEYHSNKPHTFVSSILLLKSKHLLAVGALLIALLIDLLVLFCGILGSLPKSYLDLKNIEEMEGVVESSIEAVFSSANSEETPNDSEPLNKNLRKLLNCAVAAEYESVRKGYPIFVTKTDIDEQNLGKEVGILVATQNAKFGQKTENEEEIKVYLRTRFLLWASSKLNTKSTNT